MLSINEFRNFKITTGKMIIGGSGTSGSGTCNTGNCTGTDCNSYTYSDDCGGGNKVITSETITEGACQ